MLAAPTKLGPLMQLVADHTSCNGPLLMGIVNATPDSFSDGHPTVRAAVDQGVRLLDEGADVLDIGGESTRPGAKSIPATDEIDRVVPVIKGVLAKRPRAILSVDTQKPSVAEQALSAGAQIINDVGGLRLPAMRALAAQTDVEVIVMHMRGTPETMQQQTSYTDLEGEVLDALAEQARLAQEAGVAPQRIFLDPGIGFGKDRQDNPRLIRMIPSIRALGFGVLIGASRKSFIGERLNLPVAKDRVHGSVGVALAAAAAGAHICRVHDVLATKHALTMFWACR